MNISENKYSYCIPGSPATKKNSQRIAVNRKTGKAFIMQSHKYEDYEDKASYYLRPKPKKPIDYPVTVKCAYYMPTRRRIDTSNLNSAIHDILVKFGVLADDNRDIIASTDGTRTYYDKDNPRVEITITPFEEEYEQWKATVKRPKETETKCDRCPELRRCIITNKVLDITTLTDTKRHYLVGIGEICERK